MTNKQIFIAKSADVLGKVKIGDRSSIWFQAVLRGDFNQITIGRGSNIQDGSVVHVDLAHPTIIGNDVTVGHNCIIHGCELKNNVLVGMGSTVMNGAVINENTLIGANSLVTEGTIIPANSLVLGSPARVVRPLTPEEIAGIKKNGEVYAENAQNFLSQEFDIDQAGFVVVKD